MHRVQKRNHSIFRMRMVPDEAITGHFPAGTNDPKHIKLVPGRTIQSLLIEFFLDLYESLANQTINYNQYFYYILLTRG